ncbi:MAG: GerMN domain-containing protein [Spirochaetales bacterium]|nr:GerMN domain-containing protein [Spirochaetales bacterium]
MAQRKSGTRNGSAKKSGAGCLIWLLGLLVTLLLFVFSWNEIQETFKATGFSDALGVSADETADASSSDQSADSTARPDDAAPIRPADPTTEPPADAGEADGSGDDGGDGSAATQTPVVTAPVVVTPMQQVSSTRVTGLFFIRVDDDGVITRHEVKRTIAVSDSPMTDALEALMAGPSTEELARGYISLIPADARLLSARVRGSTAYLDFNEAFMYNRYGIEGYAGQLKQIVYTATGFPTVKDVQILIEGQKREYLGGDGVYIGKPLSRASF